MFRFLLIGFLLLWIWGGALGIFAAMWVPLCLVFLLFTWIFGLDFRITLFVFAVIIVLQLFKGNEPLFVSSKIEDQPEYFITPYGEYETSLNNEAWYDNPTKASWKWIHKRINGPRLQEWLKEHNMTEDELLKIGRKNTGEWYKQEYHSEDPDYVPPQ